MADKDKNKKESGGSKMPLIILALTNLLSVGALAYFVLIEGGDEAAAGASVNIAAAASTAPELGPTTDLGTFRITLADPGQNRYLKAVLKARVNGAEVLEEIEVREPEIRDRIIDYLSSLTVKETQGSSSKAAIRENLQKRINNILRTGEVDSVFLTQFVTQ